MRSFLPILSALATATTAAALPAPAEQPAVPNLPEGFFAGFNNPDGTTTLQFLDLNQNLTFTPTEAPEAAGLERRVAGSSCWGGALDSQGTDRGMNAMRERTSHTPIGLGQYSDWPAYFGYNNLGVYVYFCVNNGAWFYQHAFTRADLDAMSGFMDQRCGAYRDGYVWHNEDDAFLFGKARSGTKVCQGNPRSSRSTAK
ncbi:hypothetical protein HBI56_206940 [Parastagonospora nodorum]|uniref:Uncharacterized protein n=2 Tax=Phaeosphaeria nodorum (strain SN15 / ATCC MYA-4574 / FGSC 10173) TaxID=321614 RepID=Q0TYE9_PHANO|nr:hypothetical protein SNOG_15493 [Parastagonospora nodorum SN15]KAH3905465.1 hypothetical protein HBH56_218060 [Parastagonospora nodorum]EAT77158.1 hypothetical protein SNOG_15493 [Parastagonospora nodorum SN15]KAH3922771.1 hypothetical protein HBH54_219920 [Parastagonospora nodorum]KAH3941151.1 hypothetical protein HBH53_205670 [Parastagonospora nodorum]KAH3961484.1 hypothetical protein HBH52_230770 [Parastagonospora nodorum]